MNLYLKNLILLFSVFLLFSIKTRYLERTSSYGYGLPYGKALYRKSMSELDLINEDGDFEYGLYPSLTFYSKKIDKAYGKCDLTRTNDLSILYHGLDNFYLNDLFYDSKIPADFKYSNLLDGITINPSYSSNEKGFVLGVGAYKEKEINGRDWNIRVNAHLPVKELEVKNETGFDSISYDSVGLPPEIVKNWVDFELTNKGKKAFAIRLDKAFENDLVNISKGDEYYFAINPNVSFYMDKDCQCSDDGSCDDGSCDDAEDLSISKESFLKGKLFLKKDNKNNIDNIEFLSNSFFGKDGKKYEPTINIAKPSNDNLFQPVLGLYDLFDSKNLFLNNFKLVVAPRYREINTNDEEIFFNFNGNILDKKNSVYFLGKNSKIFLSAIPDYINDNNGEFETEHKYINFYVPVIIQYSPEKKPEKFYKEVTLSEHVADTTDYTYEEYDGADNKLTVENNTLSIPNNTKPGYFFYKDDLTGLESCNNLSDYWITTSIDIDGETTEESDNFVKAIESKLLTNSEDGIDENIYGVEFSKLVLSGWFKNGASLGSSLKKPEMKNEWKDYKKRGLGDLDLEISFGSQFLENKFAADLIIGAILPTSEIVNYKNNYLTTPLGNNGHFEYRVGLQSSYDINYWMRLLGCAIGSAAMTGRENIIPAFKGAKAFGLQPNTIMADVSWQNILASLDLSMFANENSSMSLKYQFNYKTKDNFSNYTKRVKDAFGNLKDIDLSLLKKVSERESHKLICSMSTFINSDIFFNFGASTIFAGKNIGQENEFFFTAAISY